MSDHGEDSADQVRAMMQAFLAQEPYMRRSLEDALGSLLNADDRHRVLSMVDMIRCYGQVDGLLTYVERGEDLGPVLDALVTEIHEINVRVDVRRQNCERVPPVSRPEEPATPRPTGPKRRI